MNRPPGPSPADLKFAGDMLATIARAAEDVVAALQPEMGRLVSLSGLIREQVLGTTSGADEEMLSAVDQAGESLRRTTHALAIASREAFAQASTAHSLARGR